MALKIEMVVPALVPAGMEMVVARLTSGLVRRGHETGITCIEFEGSLGAELREQGYRVNVVRAPGLRTMVFPTRLAAWFRELRPDVVHVHSGAWLKAARAATRAGVHRVVHTVHGLLDVEPWYGPAMKRWAAKHTSAIATVSWSLSAYMLEQARVPQSLVHVVPNGIDTDIFRPGPRGGIVRRRFGLTEERLVVGHVARFSHVKNHRGLVEAFARARRRRPELFLALVGDGELRPDIEAQVAASGIADAVGFFGHTKSPAQVYRDFDVFALPSFAEGTSMSILEAMATGLPVVATAVGGTPDLLDAGRAGVLVDRDDVPCLAEALERLAQNQKLRSELGRRSRDHVLAHYSENAMLDEYERLYRDGHATSLLEVPKCAE